MLRMRIAALTIMLVVLLLWGAAEAPGVEEPTDKPRKAQEQPSLSLPVGRFEYYQIFYLDQPVGYGHFKVERKIRLMGENFFKIRSSCRLKIGIGMVQDLRFDSEMALSEKGLQPSSFFCLQRSGQTEFALEALFSKGVIAQRNLVGKEEKGYALPVSGTEPTFIFFQNLWGRVDTFLEHYWLLLLASRRGEDPVKIYDPIIRGLGTLKFTSGGLEKIRVDSQEIPCRVLEMSDFYGQPSFRIWYEEKASRILKMDEIDGGFTFRLSERSVEKEMDKIAGVDLWNGRVFLSPIYFPKVEELRHFRAHIKARLRGLKDPNHEVAGFSQKFEGEKSSGSLDGLFEIRTSAPDTSRAGAFPVKNLPEEVRAYLQPEPGIESDNQVLAARALQITWKAENQWEAAKKIGVWISEKIKTGVSLPSALFALENNEGNGESKAMLQVAMCRAVGIPARKVGGVIFANGNFIPHHWAEVYLEKVGWVPIDPTMVELGMLDATHIYLWEFGDLVSLALENIEYGPKPPKSVSFFKKELAWTPGEERVYSIKRHGEEMGHEKARVRDILLVEGRELYQFECETSLKVSESKFLAKGTALFSPEGLPVDYKMESIARGKGEKMHFLFTEGNIINQMVEYSDESVKREIPYSRGTYLTDGRFLSLWALVVGQIPQIKIGGKYSLTAFAAEDLSFRKVGLEIKNFEKVEAGDEEFDVFRADADNGMVFYLTKDARAVKISVPTQGLEAEMISLDMRP